MSTCRAAVSPIYENEFIGDSLGKINQNFRNLQNAACQLERQVNNIVNVRTFFYYGPNAASDPYSGMNSGQQNYPSFNTIEQFVNSPSRLNLPANTEINDICYVVYQKTGWYQVPPVTYQTTDSGSVTFTTQEQYTVAVTRRIGIGGGKGGGSRTTYETRIRDVQRAVPWSVTIPVTDNNTVFAPSFVIYKLTNFTGEYYTINAGFPKFVQATSGSTSNWNKPNFWSIY